MTQTAAQAARTVGIADRTARRWLRKASIRAYLHGIEGAAIEGAARIGTQFLASSMATAIKILQDPAVYPSTRLAAVRTVFDVVLKVREQVENEERLCEIERQLEELVWISSGGVKHERDGSLDTD